MKCTSTITEGANLQPFSQDEIKNEPMLFSCSDDAAWFLGGPITQHFMAALKDYHGKLPADLIIDTRVHMLMPGWWPAIPGWHHDDVPRSRSDGQPNYDTPEYQAEHAMAMFGGDICPTEFALGQCELPDVPVGHTVYKEWHPEIDRLCDAGTLKRWKAPSNRLVFFDWMSLHQGTCAVAGGWRWFGRASWNTQRNPSNEVRRQVQVYLEHPMEGW